MQFDNQTSAYIQQLLHEAAEKARVAVKAQFDAEWNQREAQLKSQIAEARASAHDTQKHLLAGAGTVRSNTTCVFFIIRLILSCSSLE